MITQYFLILPCIDTNKQTNTDNWNSVRITEHNPSDLYRDMYCSRQPTWKEWGEEQTDALALSVSLDDKLRRHMNMKVISFVHPVFPEYPPSVKDVP